MKEKIQKLIEDALKNLGLESGGFIVEHPEDLSHGDYSSNVAMVSAKKVGMNPRELANKIVKEISARSDLAETDLAEIEKVEIAGLGFINFKLSREFFSNSVKEIIEKEDDFGKIN